MEQRACNAYVRRNGRRRPLLLIEDDSLDPTTLDLSPPGSSAVDIVVCTGPERADYCPLVADGFCPVGSPDVVVSNLSEANPWSASVRAAWREAGVPLVTPKPDEPPLVWPAHIGAAIRDRWSS